MPLRSDDALAAVGDVFATVAVLVSLTWTCMMSITVKRALCEIDRRGARASIRVKNEKKYDLKQLSEMNENV